MIAQECFADVRGIRRRAVTAGAKPPPLYSLDEWADEHFRLSAESSAQAGRWRTLPYQRDFMRAITDPKVTRITMMKSARIGYTLCVSAAVGYYVHQSPCSILFVQPTVDDAKSFSKETISTMIRDVPVLRRLMNDEAEGVESESTIQGKTYPGGRLSLVGANSGAGFRRRSCRVAICDEIDGYPESAGSDGDPIKLAEKRTEYFWNRKIICGSTPLVAGHSRIEALYHEGDERRYYVPCPECGHMDYLVFTQRDSGGHYMVFDAAHPEGAHFVCSANGCVIEHQHKRDMVARGEWRAAKPFDGHASFHIWAAYSFSPNASWGDIAKEFLEAKKNRETLRTFVNTTLGETWQESGDAPDWERLFERREHYPIASVPDGAKFLTIGVDVQKDRWVYEVVGWAPGKESWSIDAGVIMGDTSNEVEWLKLDELRARTYPSSLGPVTALMTAIDSGYNTQMVYAYVRTRAAGNQVIAVKGAAAARAIVSAPTVVDVHHNGRRIARGAKVWPLGVDMLKAELYGFLRLSAPTEPGERYPLGFCHFPEYGAEYFRQLTAEHLVSVKSRKGYRVFEWQLIPGRENHWLDTRNYARAAASLCGLDRMHAKPASPPAAVAEVVETITTSGTPATPPPAPKPPPPPAKQKSSDYRLQRPGFLGSGRKSWLR